MDNAFKTIDTARRRLIRMHFESGVGHIGGNLSCLDILVTLFQNVMGPDDQFILSKGHAAGALYIALWTIGKLSDDDLLRFHAERTNLSAHPAPNAIPEILFATGSLGHGFPLSCGLALAKQTKGQSGRVYCLMSDGEWQEGSNWEALIFCAHHKLPVTAVVDVNGLQGFGTTHDVAGMDSLASLIKPHNVEVVEIDGHDPAALKSACGDQRPGPLIVLANTHKGNRVSFMEDRVEWHYLPLTDELYRQSLRELGDE